MSDKEISRFEVLHQVIDRRMTQQQAGQVLGLTWTRFPGLDCGSENGASKRTFKRTYSRTYCDLKLTQLNGIYIFI
jgi:hypothetical protein